MEFIPIFMEDLYSNFFLLKLFVFSVNEFLLQWMPIFTTGKKLSCVGIDDCGCAHGFLVHGIVGSP